MLVAPYNDVAFARSLISEHASQIAGVIVEPLQRVIPPAPGFLAAIREECDKNGIILIFDEVVTGFRFAYGGAQELYGVTPDVCTLGKVIGGGFPLAAIAGKADIMDHFDKEKVGPDSFLMQVGTLSGNPVAAVAGIKTLEILRRPGQYEKLLGYGETLINGIGKRLRAKGHAVKVSGHPSMFDVIFTDHDICNYRDVLKGDREKALVFNRVLLENGIFRSPSKFYISLALTDEDIAQTLAAVEMAAMVL